MTRVRRCADCQADISHRGSSAKRCEACSWERELKHQRQRRAAQRLPRNCQDCGATISQRGSRAKRCASCADDYAREYNRDYLRQYYADHREELAAKNRARAQQPGAKVARRAQWQRYQSENRDAYNAYQRDWRAANRERVRDISHLSDHRRRARKAGVQQEPFPRDWLRTLVATQSGCCNGCARPFGDQLPPTLDHIVPLSRGGAHSPANTQALCRPCNAAKGDRMPDGPPHPRNPRVELSISLEGSADERPA